MTTAVQARSVAARPQAGGRGNLLSDIAVMTLRYLRHIPRNPELLIFATIQPVMFVVLFRYVFGGAIAIEGTTYVNFLMAGIFVQTVTFGSMNTGMGLAQDLTKGLIDRFRSLPMARSAVVIGRVASDLVVNSLVVVIMITVGVLVGFRPDAGVGGWLTALGLLLLVSFTFSWISASIGLFVKTPEAVNSAGFIWLFPLTFCSSAFVQTDTMPRWLRLFAEHQPLTVMIDAVRAAFLQGSAGRDGWLAVAWCLAITAVFVPLSAMLYRKRTGG